MAIERDRVVVMTMTVVLIIGAGPAGIATAACLNLLSIPNIILEREDCSASLWKRRSYDRLKLHLAKQFCALPHMPHAATAPKFIPKNDFVRYLDNYVDHFRLNPICCREVGSASYDGNNKTWTVGARNTITGEMEEYRARFLVVATGENAQPVIPQVPGMESFSGEVIHSSQYKSGKDFEGKAVLVVGCGNSGMEIAYDLSDFGVTTSIAIRSPFHVMSKTTIYMGMVLLKYLPVNFVDSLMLVLSKLKYGDLTKYGIVRPNVGPFLLKNLTGRSAVLDVGTVKRIKSGKIQVVKGLSSVRGNGVTFSDGSSHPYDSIVFATGYKSTVNTWLKEDGGDDLFNENGWPKQPFPNHWKGTNGLYCAGFARRGLVGVSTDAQKIANDIQFICNTNQIPS